MWKALCESLVQKRGQNLKAIDQKKIKCLKMSIRVFTISSFGTMDHQANNSAIVDGQMLVSP